MSFRQVVESALGFARDGFPTISSCTGRLAVRIGWRSPVSGLGRVYLPNGKPPALGSLFTQPDLARTLTLMVEAEQQALGRASHAQPLCQAARDVFYKGDVARRMVQACTTSVGCTPMKTLPSYTSPLEEPLSTTYRGYQLFCTWTGITLLRR